MIINGGTIYAFAHPSSPDAGLDSGNGTYINGGTVIATGNMVDRVESDSKQKFIYASFNKISADSLVVIKDKSDNIIAAFKTSRDITNLIYSSSSLESDSYKIYVGGTIDGEETNGLYTKINSYTDGEEITYNDASQGMNAFKDRNVNNKSKVILIALIGEIALLAILVAVYIIGKRKIKKA